MLMNYILTNLLGFKEKFTDLTAAKKKLHRLMAGKTVDFWFIKEEGSPKYLCAGGTTQYSEKIDLMLEKYTKIPKCEINKEEDEVQALFNNDFRYIMARQAERHALMMKKAQEILYTDQNVEEATRIVRKMVHHMYNETHQMMTCPIGLENTNVDIGRMALLCGGSFSREELMPFSDCDVRIIYEDTSHTEEAIIFFIILIVKGKLAIFMRNPDITDLSVASFSVDREGIETPEDAAKFQSCYVMLDAVAIHEDEVLLNAYNLALTKEVDNFEKKTDEGTYFSNCCMELTAKLNDNGVLNKKTNINLKDDIYRPLSYFTSMLAVIFDKELEGMRAEKNSIKRLKFLFENKKISEPFLKMMEDSLWYIMQKRIKQHEQKGKADDKTFIGSLEEDKVVLLTKSLNILKYMIFVTRNTWRKEGLTKAFQVLKEKLSQPILISDEMATNCQMCGKKFSGTKDKQHCRYCGGVLCSSCAPSGLQKNVPGYTSSQRVCKFCFNYITKLVSTGTLKPRKQWVPNIPVCQGCGQAFSIFKKRHHCRDCGGNFCATCSSYTKKLTGSNKAVRVCKNCAED